MKTNPLLATWRSIFQNENVNFLLTNRIPRIALTRFVGRLSKIRHPWVTRPAIGLWKLFTDLNLAEAAHTDFASLHDCFTRRLKPGARVVDTRPEVLASPSDGIVGECGPIQLGQLFQAKGFGYSLTELLQSAAHAQNFEGGTYVTLRLTSAMYHRFHAPHDLRIHQVDYIGGDTWNVNPIALQRVQKLFCKNERAVLHAQLGQGGHRLALVPVAAILVASIRLHFANVLLHVKYPGPNRIDCDASALKGQELGWFEHGSTIIVLAPAGFTLCSGIRTGSPAKMGQALMKLPPPALSPLAN